MFTRLPRAALLLSFSLSLAVTAGCGSSAAFYCADFKDDGACAEYDASFVSRKAEILATCHKDSSAVSGDGACPRQNAVATCTAQVKDAACGTSCGSATAVYYAPLKGTTTIESLRSSCSQLGGTFTSL